MDHIFGKFLFNHNKDQSVVISRHHIPVARVDRVKYRAEYITRKHISNHKTNDQK